MCTKLFLPQGSAMKAFLADVLGPDSCIFSLEKCNLPLLRDPCRVSCNACVLLSVPSRCR